MPETRRYTYDEVMEKYTEKLRVKRKYIKRVGPDVCNRCEHNFQENYSRRFLFREEKLCLNCFKEEREKLTTPYYQNHIPTYCDGGTYTIFEFEEEHELLEHLKMHKRVHNLFVQSDGFIMTQNLDKDSWWVLGTVFNFEMTIPKINYDIYVNGKVDIKKAKEWLGEDKWEQITTLR
jgi:hypothetical protein